jgi:hypothetical protein
MDTLQLWLDHPAAQSGLIPFMVALLVATLLQRVQLSGLAIFAGFATAVYLISEFSFSPLTSSRKIILLGIVSTLIAMPYIKFRGMHLILTIAGGAAAVWTVQSILKQQELQNMLLWGTGCAMYVGWLVYWMDTLQQSPVRAASAGMALGFGTGLATLIGASAFLGQLGIALGSAASAFLVIMSLTNRRMPMDRNFTFPLSLITGLLGCVGVLAALLPWYCLPVLALIPILAKLQFYDKHLAWFDKKIVWFDKHTIWVHSILLSGITLSCAAVAVYLSWRVNGLPPF